MDQLPDWEHIHEIKLSLLKKPWELPDPASVVCYFKPGEDSEHKVRTEFQSSESTSTNTPMRVPTLKFPEFQSFRFSSSCIVPRVSKFQGSTINFRDTTASKTVGFSNFFGELPKWIC
jgi:hypothetical protein